MALLQMIFFAVLATSFANHLPYEAEILSITSKVVKAIPEEDVADIVALYKSSTRADEVVINEKVDELLLKLNNYIVVEGLDPTPLEDQGFEWKFRWLLVTYSAQMTLKNGWLQGLGSLERVGDSTISSDGGNLTLTLPVTFRDLKFTYDYKAKLMGLGPWGGVKGGVSDPKFTIVIEIDSVTLEAQLGRYKLNKPGKIYLKFTGNILVDWIVNMLTSVTITFLKPVLKIFVSSWVLDGVNQILLAYNQAVCSIVGTCF